MWIGLQVDPNWLHEVFGVQTIGQVDIEMVRFGYRQLLLGQELDPHVVI